MKEHWTISARKHEKHIKPNLIGAKPGMTLVFGDVAVIHTGDELVVFTKMDCPSLPEGLREHAQHVFADYEAKHPDYEPFE